MHSRVPSVRKGDAMKLGNAYNIRTATNVLQRNPSLFKPLVNLTLIVFVVFDVRQPGFLLCFVPHGC